MNAVCAKVIPVKTFYVIQYRIYLVYIYTYTLFWYSRSLILQQQCCEYLKSHKVKFPIKTYWGVRL